MKFKTENECEKYLLSFTFKIDGKYFEYKNQKLEKNSCYPVFYKINKIRYEDTYLIKKITQCKYNERIDFINIYFTPPAKNTLNPTVKYFNGKVIKIKKLNDYSILDLIDFSIKK